MYFQLVSLEQNTGSRDLIRYIENVEIYPDFSEDNLIQTAHKLK